MIDSSKNWDTFTAKVQSTSSDDYERLFTIQEEYSKHVGVVLECRMGIASVFYKLASISLRNGYYQLAHNQHQLAMAMYWDTFRDGDEAFQCLQRPDGLVWGVNWEQFMEQYLNLAFHLKRHEPEGLPKPVYENLPKNFRITEARIAIASVCAYNETSSLHGIDKISLRNRNQYVRLHGSSYTNVFSTENEVPERHPVWSAVALPLRLLKTGLYDFVIWMDCDALFVDVERTIESMIMRDPEAEFWISEDGRGLSGGNWIAKNTPWTISLLESVIGDRTFDKHDLRDQFSFLWHLLRPSLSMSPFEHDKTWGGLGYPSQVRLLPQKLINAYPWSLCRPSHHCFEDNEDFIVSFITLSSLSRDMAFALLNNFASSVVLPE